MYFCPYDDVELEYREFQRGQVGGGGLVDQRLEVWHAVGPEDRELHPARVRHTQRLHLHACSDQRAEHRHPAPLALADVGRCCRAADASAEPEERALTGEP